MSTKKERIDLANADTGFMQYVASKVGLQEIKPCYTCGSCTSVCPVREAVEDFDPRRLIHMIALGMKKEVLSSDLIWLCCLCETCYSVCPQGIRFSRVALELQKMAEDQGYVDEEFIERLKLVDNHLKDLCRRTMFLKVRNGSWSAHKMPCWRKFTKVDG